MSAEALFGDGPDRAEFEVQAAERADVEPDTHDHVSPVTLSIAYCPALVAATYAYEC